jgi:hypothetical protein
MPSNVTLESMSDFEFLHAMNDAGDDDGWATSEEIAKQIGLDVETADAFANQCVGSRCAWSYRYGLVEKGIFEGQLYWRLNPTGTDLVLGRALAKGVQQTLADLSESQRVRVTDLVAKAAPRGSRQAAHLTRRTFKREFTDGWRDPALFKKRRNGKGR